MDRTRGVGVGEGHKVSTNNSRVDLITNPDADILVAFAKTVKTSVIGGAKNTSSRGRGG